MCGGGQKQNSAPETGSLWTCSSNCPEIVRAARHECQGAVIAGRLKNSPRVLLSQSWEQDDLPYAVLVGQQHNQTVDSSSPATGGRHAVLQSLDVIFIQDLGLVVPGRALASLVFEACPLLEWIIELGKGIAQLEPAGKRLEALGDPIGAGLGLGQRRDIS